MAWMHGPLIGTYAEVLTITRCLPYQTRRWSVVEVGGRLTYRYFLSLFCYFVRLFASTTVALMAQA